MALKQLEALASGPCGKHNVYIPNYNDVKANSFQLFHIYLPGIRATVERRPNDRYVVSKLELSDGYKAIEGRDKPGIYSVNAGSDETSVNVSYRKMGKITSKDGRVVVIADGNHSNIYEAADANKKYITQALGEFANHSGEFDLLYSPLGNKFGKQFDPMSITDAYAFSSLLAQAMEHIQHKKHVIWLAERGGSAVFTQGMEIAIRNNISFDGKNHLAQLYKPTTSPTQAVKLTCALGITLPANAITLGGFQPRVAASSLIANAHRVRNKNDTYSLKDYGTDLAKGAMDGVALGGVFALGASLALPGIKGFGVVGTTLSCLGALHLLHKKLQNRK